jgi:hypothetical protein
VDPFYFSSRKFGSGLNLPSEREQEVRYSDIAVDMNNNVTLAPLANSTTLGKEWGYYKRNIDNRRKELQEEQKKEEKGIGGGYRGGDRGGDNGDFRRGERKKSNSP